MMEDSDRRIAPLAAYAALVCGAAFACLVLLSGPASAEGAEAPRDGEESSLLGLDEVGDRVAETTRGLGREAGDLVTEVSEPVRPVAPAVEQVTEQVAGDVVAVTDALADQVARVSEVVDVPALPAPQEPEPPATAPTPAPTAEPAAPRTTRPTVTKADRPGATHRRVGVRPQAMLSAHRVEQAAATLPTVTDPLPAATVAVPAPVPEDPGPLAPVAGCDGCAACGAPSADPLHVLGLPAQGVTTPRSADLAPRDAAAGGPTTIFDRPDVSPD